MTSALVGYTGFVGGNLAATHRFDSLYNSKNITDAFGSHPHLLVYSGVKAEMFLANKFPEQDMREMEGAVDNIRRIAPRRLVLISTIGVYADTRSGDESSASADAPGLAPYGRNRLFLEQKVRGLYPDALIVRLPALFGINLKKNFIYDMIHVVPKMLRDDKYNELLGGTPLADCYTDRGDGFRLCTVTDPERLAELRRHLTDRGFTALNFTDSRSQYQFFNLGHLWGIIEKALETGLHELTVTSRPLTAAQVYAHVTGKEFVNEINPNHPVQNLRSRHAGLFGGADGYIFPDSAAMLDDIKRFVEANR